MASPVTFHNDETAYRLRDKRKIAAWVTRCIEKEGYTAGPISYIFCSPDKHIDINRRYLGHDYHTDVITFDYTDHENKVVSGDIFIDPATVGLNARQWGQTSKKEMLRVIIHGVLHLCGNGDKTEAEQKIMRDKEDDCLSDFDNA